MVLIYGIAFIIIPYDTCYHYGKTRMEISMLLQIGIILIGNLLKIFLCKLSFGSMKISFSDSDIVSFMDIFVSFCSGFVDNDSRKVVLNRSEIFKRYLSGKLWIDLLSSFPDTAFHYIVSSFILFEVI